MDIKQRNRYMDGICYSWLAGGVLGAGSVLANFCCLAQQLVGQRDPPVGVSFALMALGGACLYSAYALCFLPKRLREAKIVNILPDPSACKSLQRYTFGYLAAAVTVAALSGCNYATTGRFWNIFDAPTTPFRHLGNNITPSLIPELSRVLFANNADGVDPKKTIVARLPSMS